MLIISFFIYLKIRRIFFIDVIRKIFGFDKNVIKVNYLILKLILNMLVIKFIFVKNIFRNKKGFMIIVLFMSIGGIIVIKDNYKYFFLDV